MLVLAGSSQGVAAPAQQSATSNLRIEFAGLRDARGVVRLCLISNPAGFPDCRKTDALHATVEASTKPSHFEFRAVSAGTYAVAAFHDANRNGKLDTLLGIPTEGFAFSRNPPLHARAPHFNEASFQSNVRSLPPLKMKYLL